MPHMVFEIYLSCSKNMSNDSLFRTWSLFNIRLQVIGLNHVPCAGDEFEVVGSLDIAREKAESRAESIRNERISAKAGDGKVTLSSFASAVSSRNHAGLDLHQLVIIMKVDLQVSINIIFVKHPDSLINLS